MMVCFGCAGEFWFESADLCRLEFWGFGGVQEVVKVSFGEV